MEKNNHLTLKKYYLAYFTLQYYQLAINEQIRLDETLENKIKKNIKRIISDIHRYSDDSLSWQFLKNSIQNLLCFSQNKSLTHNKHFCQTCYSIILIQIILLSAFAKVDFFNVIATYPIGSKSISDIRKLKINSIILDACQEYLQDTTIQYDYTTIDLKSLEVEKNCKLCQKLISFYNKKAKS